MEKIKSYKDLIVYKRAYGLALMIYKLTKDFLHATRYTLHAIRYILYAIFFFFTLHPIPYTLNDTYALVTSTKHNLSTTGPGPIKSLTENQICVFCHTPHGAITLPLWNHTLSPVSTLYTVPSPTGQWSTMLSTPQNPPDGDSKLCLSCHDGTVAIGSIVNVGGAVTTVSMHDMGTGYLTPEGKLSATAPSYIGTDLSGHHPVSIEVNTSLINDKNYQCQQDLVTFTILDPPGVPIKYRPTDNRYGTGPFTGVGVQCSSCHDAHEDINKYFLRVPYGGTPWEIDTYPLCTKCHVLCP